MGFIIGRARTISKRIIQWMRSRNNLPSVIVYWRILKGANTLSSDDGKFRMKIINQLRLSTSEPHCYCEFKKKKHHQWTEANSKCSQSALNFVGIVIKFRQDYA